MVKKRGTNDMHYLCYQRTIIPGNIQFFLIVQLVFLRVFCGTFYTENKYARRLERDFDVRRVVSGCHPSTCGAQPLVSVPVFFGKTFALFLRCASS